MSEELRDTDDAHALVFAAANLPEFVFQPIITSCAWVDVDGLCCVDGWSLLRDLASQHGDASVRVTGVDLQDPEVLTLLVDSDPDRYRAICDDELVGAGKVRWWGSSGRWGIHGSRDLEIAVAGHRGETPWPRSAECNVLSIDAAMRLARSSDEVRRQLFAAYDSSSWDPASEEPQALPDLLDLCHGVLADSVEPVVAIRSLVDLLNRAPKNVRRIPATGRLHQAWTRTHYILLGEDRAPWGSLLLAQNDHNHARHAVQERPLVRQACEEILAAARRPQLPIIR